MPPEGWLKRGGCPPIKNSQNDYEMMVPSFQENNGVNDTKIILEFYLCRPNNDQHAHSPWGPLDYTINYCDWDWSETKPKATTHKNMGL